ncbi:MAG: GIY-YIG nuclease family protein, partial [Deltaproteobacteria bacterium]|nr:GIY-YIG nuclease family protein [Deltaproteobacteria bacterium]
MKNRSLFFSEKFPKKPGVYWMKDAEGRILYIGKAKNLKARVASYFHNEAKQRYQISFLMRRTAAIDYLVTDNEKEALLLENTLIKKHQPRYNIFLRDDKSYAGLKLTAQHPFPGIYVTRQIAKDGAAYFGPYASAWALRQTVDFLTRHFRLRTCSDHEFANRSRPCLQYDIGRCCAPCVGKVSKEEYA